MTKLVEANRCPDCLAWHGVWPLEALVQGVPCGHDKESPCVLCGKPIGPLSTGGSEVCGWCETSSRR